MATEEDNLNVMSSEATSDVNERVQETAFNDAAIVSNDESAAPETAMTQFQELSSILAFLKRPALIWQSRIDSTTPAISSINSIKGPSIVQVPLKTFSFPAALMSAGRKMDKILNFEWFKTDIRLRILVNANPFVAGRLFVTYSPIDRSDNVTTLQRYARIENKGRVGITSYPGVELDLQTNTAAELTVPWIAETDAERADISHQKLFRVDIWMLTPLLVADSSLGIPIQVYASFDNIQLKFPTPIYRSATRQVKGEAKGPITEISSGISRFAKRAENIPVVGSIASSVGWAADLANGVASFFGWTRPIEGSHSEPLAHIPGRGMAHFKAKDSSTVLGMANDNEIGEKHQNFISDVDEMDLSHICSRPGLIDVIDWSVDQDYNTTLGSYGAWRKPENSNTAGISFVDDQNETVSGTARDHTLAEFVLQNFHLYRADWTFRISLVKTAFHVGRFEVFFVPNVGPKDIDFSTLDTTNCYRQIFDITEQSEMSFEVPYLHKFVMLRTQEYESNVGTLVIRVVSPLTCPETVSRSIKILVWKFATNVAVAQPAPLFHTPLLTWVAGSKAATRQINVQNEPKGTHYLVFDRDNSFATCLDATTVVAGENCVNLRQATRAFRRHVDGLSVTTQGLTGLIPNVLDWRSGGYLAVCSYIFYFFRGGLSTKIVDLTGKGLRTWLGNRRDDIYIEGFGNAPFHFTPPNNPIHEVTVPFYSTTRRQVCSKLIDSEQPTIDPDMPIVAVQTLQGDEVSKTDVIVFCGAKDDMTFGFLIGVPITFKKE